MDGKGWRGRSDGCGIAEPDIGDHMLVDGGVLNNLPVDVMAATGEGPDIAVDVTNRFEPPAPRENGPTRTRRFWHRREHREEEDRLPGFSEALTRALLLGSVDTAEAARVHAS